jgi:GH35 family endo-1,4-beta-xylanase
MAFNMQLKELLQKGLPIDEIGLQYHIFVKAEDLTDPLVHSKFLNATNMVEILDIYNKFNLPMHISEITIPSYCVDYSVNEEVQAELTKALYETWFATENMKSIVWWNLVDGYGAYAPLGSSEGENYYGGGLLRFDMSEKPAYKVIDKLINEDWNTSFVKSISSNELSFRGFYGDYEITIEDENGKETKNVKLHENEAIVSFI